MLPLAYISSLLRTSVPWSFILREQGSWFFARWWWHSGLAPAEGRRCECQKNIPSCSRVPSWTPAGKGVETWELSRIATPPLFLSSPLNQKTCLVFLGVSPAWCRILLALCPLPGPLTVGCRPCMKAAIAHSLTSINQHCRRIAQDMK